LVSFDELFNSLSFPMPRSSPPLSPISGED
jgi:hypothetical protein